MGIAHVRRRAALIAALALAVAGGRAAPALAHDAPYSYLTLRAEPTQLRGRLTVHGFDLAHELGAPADAPPSIGDTLLAPGAASRSRSRRRSPACLRASRSGPRSAG